MQLTVDDLIRAKNATDPLPEVLLAELRKLCQYNDKYRTRRIGYRQALELCASYGVPLGEKRLNRICQEHLGRRSYAQAK